MEKLYARDYRKIASDKCAPYSNRLALIYFVYVLIISALTALCYIGIGTIALLLVTGPFTLGLVYVTIDVFKNTKPEVNRMFEGFKRFADAFVLYLLQQIFIALWSLLLVIPGIIKSYSYSMAYYIMNDSKEPISANDAITESRTLMDGHKWELFCLDISYIGWLILCLLTLGILSFWVQPKMAASKYAFYLHITGKDQVQETVIEEVIDTEVVSE